MCSNLKTRFIFAAMLLAVLSSSVYSKTKPKEHAHPQKIILEYEFEEPFVEHINNQEIISFDDCRLYRKVGAPLVPVRDAKILIPLNKDVENIEVYPSGVKDLEGSYNLTPAPQVSPISYAGPREHAGRDEEVYGMNQAWPGVYYEDICLQYKRGYKILILNLFPLQYIPAMKKVSYVSKLSLEITLKDVEEKNVIKPTNRTVRELRDNIDNISALETYSKGEIDRLNERNKTIDSPLGRIPRNKELRGRDGKNGISFRGNRGEAGDGTSFITSDNVKSLATGFPYYGEEGQDYKYVVITSQYLADVNNFDANDSSYTYQALCDSKTDKNIPACIVTTEWIYDNYDANDFDPDRKLYCNFDYGLSVVVWAKRDQSGQEEYILDQRDDVNDGWYLKFNSEDKVVFSMGDSETSESLVSETTITDSNWHFICVTAPKSPTCETDCQYTCSMYIDSGTVVDNSTNFALDALSVDSDLIIGRQSINESGYFKGALDSVMAFSAESHLFDVNPYWNDGDGNEIVAYRAWNCMCLSVLPMNDDSEKFIVINNEDVLTEPDYSPAGYIRNGFCNGISQRQTEEMSLENGKIGKALTFNGSSDYIRLLKEDTYRDFSISIRVFLMDAFQSWGTEYVLLGGSKDYVPLRAMTAPDTDANQGFLHLRDHIASDLYYACVSPNEPLDTDHDGLYGMPQDEPDITADISAGRAPVETVEEVANFVRKTLNYENTGMNDDYLRTVLMGGTFINMPPYDNDPCQGIKKFNKPRSESVRTGYGGKTGFENCSLPGSLDFEVLCLYDQPAFPSGCTAGETGWTITNSNYGWRYTESSSDCNGWIFDANDSNWCQGWDWYHDSTFTKSCLWEAGWDCNSEGWSATNDLIPLLNGATEHPTPHIIYHTEHGFDRSGEYKGCYNLKMYTQGCLGADPDRSNPNIYSTLDMLNNTKAFFVYTDTCIPGAIDAEDCWSEEIVTMEHGAFGVISNSHYGVADSNSDSIDGPSIQYARGFFDAVLDKGIRKTGEALNDCKFQLINSITEKYMRLCYYELNLLGDPEISLRVQDCFPYDNPAYEDWVDLGKPNCWCEQPYGSGYQCDGDADGETEYVFPNGDFRVYNSDLTLVVANWQKTIDDPNLNPCADIDHMAETDLEYRVYSNDLNIVIANWKAMDANLPGDCPRASFEMVDLADSNIAVYGTTSGDYIDTHSRNDVYESIQEVTSTGPPASRYSRLEHKWTFDVSGGDTVTFYVEAYHTENSEDDDFVFAYSTTDKPNSWTDMLIVTKTSDDDTLQSYELPSSISGTVYIRVKDTDDTAGNDENDTIYVDHMKIVSEFGS